MLVKMGNLETDIEGEHQKPDGDPSFTGFRRNKS